MLRKRKAKRDSGTRSRVTKGPARDAQHLAKVRALGCFACNAQAVEAHHIRECYPRTMGKRIGDDKVVPLCKSCHAELHAHSRTFWQDTKGSVIAFAEALYAETLRRRNDSQKPRIA